MNSIIWITCLTHAACFPEGWESEHASGPLALSNGPCALVQYISDRPEAVIDIECCPETRIQYPTNGNNTECPVCHSVFTLATSESD